MISSHNKAFNSQASNDDFTVNEYRKLVRIALSGYAVATYNDIPWESRFVLWRHDLDYSINRGFVLAKIEYEEGLKATYFVNPHSEFYNIAEPGQRQIILNILSLGHDLGLHFDATFYGELTEQEFDYRVTQEANYLHSLLGKKPVALSFHNPVAAHLTCESDSYAGLINCYSRRFKTEVAYCSDSNGYWRFRRLSEVLTEARDPCLQVLTHPGWWQDAPMPPRERIFRSVYGRAAATMKAYDAGLEQHGRLNHAGAVTVLQVLKTAQPQKFELCDFLWNQGLFQTLFMELWRQHEAQINRLCKLYLCVVWLIPVSEVNIFLAAGRVGVDNKKLFCAIFEQSWFDIASVDLAEYKRWAKFLHLIINGYSSTFFAELEAACVGLCQLMRRLAEWGKSHIKYDGLADIEEIEFQTYKNGSLCLGALGSLYAEMDICQQDRWQKLKKQFVEFENSHD